MDFITDRSSNNKNLSYKSFYEQQPFLKSCSQHKNQPISYLCTDTSQENIFKCIYCVVDNLIQPNRLLPLEQIIESQDDTIISNWPIYNDQEVIGQVKNITQKQPTNLELKEKINTFFKELTSQVIQKIETQQTIMLSKADKIWDFNLKVIETYNNLSAKAEMKDTILNGMNSLQKNLQLKDIIQNVNDNLEPNKQKILEQLTILREQESSINYEQPQILKTKILKWIENIDFISLDKVMDFEEEPEILSQQQFQQEKKQQPRQQEQEQEESNNVEKIMNVIKNKFNYCQDTFINNLQNLLERYSKFINKYDLGEVHSDQLNYNLLTQSQTKQMINMMNEIINLNQSKQQRVTDSSQASLNPNLVIAKINQFKDYFSSDFVENLKQFCKGASSYLSIFKSNEIFNPTNYECSDQFSVSMDYENRNVIRIPKNVTGNIIYSNVIDNNKTYTFRFKLSQGLYIDAGYLRMGIQLEEEVDTELINSCNVLGYYSWHDTDFNIKRGDSINNPEIAEQIEEIEFRFCLSKQKLYFSDYPEYKNINCVEEDQISPDSAYCFGLSAQNLGTEMELTLTHIQIDEDRDIKYF